MDINTKLNELGSAWEEFKKTTSKAMADGKTEASEIKEKQEKMNKDMDQIQAKVDGLNAAIARSSQNQDQDLDVKEYKKVLEQECGKKFSTDEVKKVSEYKEQLQGFLRGGQEPNKELARFVAKTLSIDSETGGGFFVTPEMSSEIVKKIHESSPVRQLASKQTISTSSLKINEDLDARSITWVGEQETRSNTTTPTVRQIEIFVHEAYTYPKATSAFLEDAAINVEAWLADYAAEAFAIGEATAFINGTGVGKPRGIVGGYADGTSFGYVQRIPTDATAAITGLDLIDLQDALKDGYQRNASFMMNRLVRSIVRKVTDGTQFLWQPGLQAGVPDLLLGKPVYLAADLNTATTTGTDGLMIYGDFAQGYQVVDRRGIRVLRNPYTASGFVSFDTSFRVGGAVKNFEALKILDIV